MSFNIKLPDENELIKDAALVAGGAALGAAAYAKYKKHSFVYNHGRCPKDGTPLKLVDKITVGKGRNTYVYGIYECEKGHRYKVLLEKHIVKKRPR